MTYEVHILRRARKELGSVATNDLGRIGDAIRRLGDDPRPSECRKLTGREGWRVRVGAYRVIYEIDDELKRLTVLHVGHRRDVYR